MVSQSHGPTTAQVPVESGRNGGPDGTQQHLANVASQKSDNDYEPLLLGSSTDVQESEVLAFDTSGINNAADSSHEKKTVRIRSSTRRAKEDEDEVLRTKMAQIVADSPRFRRGGDVNARDTELEGRDEMPVGAKGRTSLMQEGDNDFQYADEDVGVHGVKDFKIPASAMKEARKRMKRAKRDRESSSLPKSVIPIVEWFLPPGKRLSQFEEEIKPPEKLTQCLFLDWCAVIEDENEEGHEDDVLLKGYF